MYKLQNNLIKRLSDGASIPFADGNRDYEEYKQWLAEGNTPEPEFTDEETLNNLKSTIESSIQNLLDSTAQSNGYDSILSATSYAGYPNDFREEGTSFGKWRGLVWKYVYQVQIDVEQGVRVMPSLDELLTELPQYTGV